MEFGSNKFNAKICIGFWVIGLSLLRLKLELFLMVKVASDPERENKLKYLFKHIYLLQEVVLNTESAESTETC